MVEGDAGLDRADGLLFDREIGLRREIPESDQSQRENDPADDDDEKKFDEGEAGPVFGFHSNIITLKICWRGPVVNVVG
jgi:hypothetical protein